MHSKARSFAAAGFAAGALACAADTVSLTPVADNTLIQENAGALSGGADDSIYTGINDDGRPVRAVLRFDVAAAVPSGSTITSATLRLNLIDNNDGAHIVYVYRVNTAWGEGTSITTNAAGAGGTSTVQSATWIHTFYSNTFWGAAGGDFTNVESAFQSVGSLGSYDFSAAALVSDVQTFLDTPATNFGWLAKNSQEFVGLLRYDSRESVTPANRPTLVIGYDAPLIEHEATSLKKLTNGFLTTWSTVSGQVYEIAFMTNVTVNPQVWTPLVTVTANSASVSMTDTNSPRPTGFYRMLKLQF